jgi:predicted nuclease of predicted toxin-antitoxin system
MAHYLIDACISRHIATALRVAGYNATAVYDVLEPAAPDPEIIQWCVDNGAILVTKDYGLKRRRLLAATLEASGISVVFFREGKRHWQLSHWFYQVFRQINHLEREFSSSPSPEYRVCRPTGKPESISL